MGLESCSNNPYRLTLLISYPESYVPNHMSAIPKVRFKRLDPEFLELGASRVYFQIKGEIPNFQESRLKSLETHFSSASRFTHVSLTLLSRPSDSH